jgi:hypothetical protein
MSTPSKKAANSKSRFGNNLEDLESIHSSTTGYRAAGLGLKRLGGAPHCKADHHTETSSATAEGNVIDSDSEYDELDELPSIEDLLRPQRPANDNVKTTLSPMPHKRPAAVDPNPRLKRFKAGADLSPEPPRQTSPILIDVTAPPTPSPSPPRIRKAPLFRSPSPDSISDFTTTDAGGRSTKDGSHAAHIEEYLAWLDENVEVIDDY